MLLTVILCQTVPNYSIVFIFNVFMALLTLRPGMLHRCCVNKNVFKAVLNKHRDQSPCKSGGRLFHAFGLQNANEHLQNFKPVCTPTGCMPENPLTNNKWFSPKWHGLSHNWRNRQLEIEAWGIMSEKNAFAKQHCDFEVSRLIDEGPGHPVEVMHEWMNAWLSNDASGSKAVDAMHRSI